MFAVVKNDRPDVFIGAIGVYNIDRENGTAEVGRTVLDDTLIKEKGLGMEATRAACKFAFNVLGVKCIVGSILKDNERIKISDMRAGYRIGEEIDEKSLKIEMTEESLKESEALY